VGGGGGLRARGYVNSLETSLELFVCFFKNENIIYRENFSTVKDCLKFTSIQYDTILS
jgi:hypothetical protein